MKKFLLISMFFALAACRDDASADLADEQTYCVSRDVVASLSRLSGRTDQIGNIYVIRTSQGTYFACNLPEAYRRSGRNIRFDAQVYRIPENVRLVGTPIFLTKIY